MCRIADTISVPYDRTNMLKLPIWIVTEHIKPTDPKGTTESKSQTALAFSDSDKLFKFVNKNLGGEWKIEMAADRDGLVILIADLHRLEFSTLSLDPKVDGTGGTELPLDDLMALAETLRTDQ